MSRILLLSALITLVMATATNLSYANDFNFADRDFIIFVVQSVVFYLFGYWLFSWKRTKSLIENQMNKFKENETKNKWKIAWMNMLFSFNTPNRAGILMMLAVAWGLFILLFVLMSAFVYQFFRCLNFRKWSSMLASILVFLILMSGLSAIFVIDFLNTAH